MSWSRQIPLLNVESLSTSLGFYRDHLGFQVVNTYGPEEAPFFASIKRDNVDLMLNTPERGIDSTARRAAPAYDHVVLYIVLEEDIDALRAEFDGKGLEPTECSDEAYGMREFYLRDPDGYELGFGMPLGE